MAVPLVTGHTFDKREDALWEENGIEAWALTLTLSGSVLFGYRGGECLAQPGDIVLHRPRTLYAMKTSQTCAVWESVWANFQPRPEWHALLNWPEMALGLM